MPSIRDLSFLLSHAAHGCQSFPLLPMTPLTPYTAALARSAPQLAGALLKTFPCEKRYTMPVISLQWYTIPTKVQNTHTTIR